MTVWELGTKKRLFDLVGLADDCDLIAFSPDSKFVAAGVDFLDCFVVRIADKRGFYVWEISSGDLVGKQKVDKEVFTTCMRNIYIFSYLKYHLALYRSLVRVVMQLTLFAQLII